MGKGAAQCSAQNVRQMIDAKRVSNELVACAQGTSHKHIVQSVPTHVPQVPPDWRKTAIRPGIQHMRVEGCIYFVYGTGRKVCRRGKLAKERVPASESLWLVMSTSASTAVKPKRQRRNYVSGSLKSNFSNGRGKRKSSSSLESFLCAVCGSGRE
jgi:hypothetical protein